MCFFLENVFLFIVKLYKKASGETLAFCIAFTNKIFDIFDFSILSVHQFYALSVPILLLSGRVCGFDPFAVCVRHSS